MKYLLDANLSPQVLQALVAAGYDAIAKSESAVTAQLLIDNLDAVEEVLRSGAIVSLSPTRLRVRELPIHDNPSPG